MLWKNSHIDIDTLNNHATHTMAYFLDIKFVEIGHDFLKASMPVGPKTHQPYGLLHGGASAVLAETVGSVASSLAIDPAKQMCVGIEINCNHIRAKKDGIVTATAEPLHVGATTHVWDIKIKDERDRLICASRLTVAILKKKNTNVSSGS
ncbi:MAG: hotdog fold thioesterase [Flavipsychrobacter sp.]|jgi:1,4-dihydroxy-2-naphthoyl-CoA hydrolase|nr:hotdog fold thioesterase [Flavipsychrobacter sp.]